jgi:hypothetical protein
LNFLACARGVGSFRYGSLCAMIPPSGANRLDPFEAWATARLEPILGPLRKIDPGGGPHALHDFEADLPNGSVAAIEVTSEVDLRRRQLEAAAIANFPTFTVPGSAFLWVVALAAHAKVKKLRREDLHRLVNDLEAAGRQRVLDIGDYRDPFVARLAALGIESIYAAKAKPGSEGTVLVRAGTYFGRGWDGPTTDQWLGELLVSDRGRNKIGKLARATAAERHLVIVLDAFSQAGMGISLALTARHERGAVEYGLPSLVPPAPLTHLWLLLRFSGTDGNLRWERHRGWSVFEASRPAATPEWPTRITSRRSRVSMSWARSSA